jgi:hypothetical protein
MVPASSAAQRALLNPIPFCCVDPFLLRPQDNLPPGSLGDLVPERDMTFEEKRKLSAHMASLPGEKLVHVLDIISEAEVSWRAAHGSIFGGGVPPTAFNLGVRPGQEQKGGGHLHDMMELHICITQLAKAS